MVPENERNQTPGIQIEMYGGTGREKEQGREKPRRELGNDDRSDPIPKMLGLRCVRVLNAPKQQENYEDQNDEP
jgi:hypothetical protein